MTEFLKFLDDLVKRFPLHVEIGYNKTARRGKQTIGKVASALNQKERTT